MNATNTITEIMNQRDRQSSEESHKQSDRDREGGWDAVCRQPAVSEGLEPTASLSHSSVERDRSGRVVVAFAFGETS